MYIISSFLLLLFSFLAKKRERQRCSVCAHVKKIVGKNETSGWKHKLKRKKKHEGHDGPGVALLSFQDCEV